MSKKNKNKKKSLGRGLGSLLGANIDTDSGGSNLLDSDEQLSKASDEFKAAKKEQDEILVAKKALAKESENKNITDVSTKASIKKQNTEAENKTIQPQEEKIKIVKEVVEVEKIVYKEKKIPEGSRIWRIGVDKIQPNQYQPRQFFDKEKVEELSLSIKEQGILQPIVVRKTENQKFEIISGERRWRAAQMAGLHDVPVIIKDVSDQNSLELALIENIQRANLNPMEEAEAYQRLADEFALTQEQIAVKVGKKRASVANTLRLLSLTTEVRAMVKEALLSQGHAKALLSVGDPIKQRELAKKVVNEKLSVRATENLAIQVQKTGVAVVVKSKNVAEEISGKLVQGLAQELQRAMGTKVKIDYSGGKGKMQIQFYSDEQLNQIAEKLKEAWL